MYSKHLPSIHRQRHVWSKLAEIATTVKCVSLDCHNSVVGAAILCRLPDLELWKFCSQTVRVCGDISQKEHSCDVGIAGEHSSGYDCLLSRGCPKVTALECMSSQPIQPQELAYMVTVVIDRIILHMRLTLKYSHINLWLRLTSLLNHAYKRKRQFT